MRRECNCKKKKREKMLVRNGGVEVGEKGAIAVGL